MAGGSADLAVAFESWFQRRGDFSRLQSDAQNTGRAGSLRLSFMVAFPIDSQRDKGLVARPSDMLRRPSR